MWFGAACATLGVARIPVLAADHDLGMLVGGTAPGITTQQTDLEDDESAAWPFETDRFAGIVLTNYLHRPLFPHILNSPAPGGVLVYETFGSGNERLGKPSSPQFLLQLGELLDRVRGLHACNAGGRVRG